MGDFVYDLSVFSNLTALENKIFNFSTILFSSSGMSFIFPPKEPLFEPL